MGGGLSTRMGEYLSQKSSHSFRLIGDFIQKGVKKREFPALSSLQGALGISPFLWQVEMTGIRESP